VHQNTTSMAHVFFLLYINNMMSYIVHQRSRKGTIWRKYWTITPLGLIILKHNM